MVYVVWIKNLMCFKYKWLVILMLVVIAFSKFYCIIDLILKKVDVSHDSCGNETCCAYGELFKPRQ